VPFEIIKPGTHIDFIGKWRLCVLLSSLLILAGLVAIPIKGVHLGIDFAGGTEVLVKFREPTDEGRVREVLREVPGVKGLSVVRYGEPADNEFLVRFQNEALDVAVQEPAAPSPAGDASPQDEEASVSPEARAKMDVIAAVMGALDGAIGSAEQLRVDFVGPRVGAELREDGIKSLLYASIAILIYVAFRFSSRFAPGAIIAVIHDLLITAGVFVILGLEFDLRVLAAMLAILGYSLNDTIIIYDRIRENMELRTARDLPSVLNESVNQTLSRTILTSGTTLVAIGSLYLLGGDVIRPFAFAMLIGVVVGTYSSIYIAAPTLLLLEERHARAQA